MSIYEPNVRHAAAKQTTLCYTTRQRIKKKKKLPQKLRLVMKDHTFTATFEAYEGV